MKPILDYSKTVIYKISCRDPAITDTYIGHTTNFENRRQGHLSAYLMEFNPAYNYPLYKSMRLNGGWENWTMEVIDTYPSCTGLTKACIRERHWIETLNPSLNTIRRPKITREERLAGKRAAYKRRRDNVK